MSQQNPKNKTGKYKKPINHQDTDLVDIRKENIWNSLQSSSKRFFMHLHIFITSCQHGVLPYSNNLAPIKLNAVHLSYEDGCHSFVECSAIHVDGGTHREHETCYSLVDAQVLLQASESDG